MERTNSYEFSKSPTFDTEQDLVIFAIKDYQKISKLAINALAEQTGVSDPISNPSMDQKLSVPPKYQYAKSQVALTKRDFENLVKLAEKALRGASDAQSPLQKQEVNQKFDIHINLKAQVVHNHEPAAKKEPEAGSLKKLSPAYQRSIDILAWITANSRIMNSDAGRPFGKTALMFFAQFFKGISSVKEIFATRHHLPKTDVGLDFHKACDNVPNVLVIIKSGQYIAGGYTEVPFVSTSRWVENQRWSSLLFSVNRQQIYGTRSADNALHCEERNGPSFGLYGLRVKDDYAEKWNSELMHLAESTFHTPGAVKGELFGTEYFAIDEYEVFQLESAAPNTQD